MPFSTDDLVAGRERKRPPAESAPEVRRERDADKPVRFTLRDMLIAVTVVAVLLAVLTQFGILGAVAAFIATVVFSWVIYPRLNPTDPRSQALMFDFLWGVGMPVICFVFDPLLFKGAFPADDPRVIDVLFEPAGTIRGARVHPQSFFVYPFVCWQMALFTAWLLLGPRAGRWSGFFAGTIAIGACFAWLIGLIVIVPALLGTMLFGIGLLGLTPILTAYVFSRQCRRAYDCGWQTRQEFHRAITTVIGVIAAVAIPAIAGLVLLAVFGATDAVRLLST